MITKAALAALGVAGLVFAGSFLGTVTVRSQSTPAPTTQPSWICPEGAGLDPATAAIVRQRDPAFDEEVAELRRELDAARAGLIQLLEKEDATDEELRGQVEAVIAAHNKVERRMAEHLIAVRQHLSALQRRQLFGLCADEIRQCRQRCARGRSAAGDAPDETRGRLGPARGHGHGRDDGRR